MTDRERKISGEVVNGEMMKGGYAKVAGSAWTEEGIDPGLEDFDFVIFPKSLDNPAAGIWFEMHRRRIRDELVSALKSRPESPTRIAVQIAAEIVSGGETKNEAARQAVKIMSRRGFEVDVDTVRRGLRRRG